MNRHLLFLFLLLLSNGLFADKDSKSSSNLLYIEAGGAGGYWSLNFEKIVFQKNMFSLSPRIGVSSYRILDFAQQINPDVLIPFGIQAHFGKNHKLSIGIGKTYSTIVRINRFTFDTERKSSFSTNFSLGYRYFPVTKKGLFLGLHYSPIVEFNKYYRNWYAFSFGYVFCKNSTP